MKIWTRPTTTTVADKKKLYELHRRAFDLLTRVDAAHKAHCPPPTREPTP